jgi:hypothetical protein
MVSKIVNKALKKAAIAFVASQLEDAVEQYENGNMKFVDYKKKVDRLVPIEKVAKELYKADHFVEYFIATYLK